MHEDMCCFDPVMRWCFGRDCYQCCCEDKDENMHYIPEYQYNPEYYQQAKEQSRQQPQPGSGTATSSTTAISSTEQVQR